MKKLIGFLLSLGFWVAMAPLGSWGANAGPVREFRIVWVLALLAYAFAMTLLQDRSDMGLRVQLAFVLKFVCLGSLLGWMSGIAMIGFDNMGFGPFLNLMAGIGIACGVIGMILGMLQIAPSAPEESVGQ